MHMCITAACSDCLVLQHMNTVHLSYLYKFVEERKKKHLTRYEINMFKLLVCPCGMGMARSSLLMTCEHPLKSGFNRVIFQITLSV